VEAGSVLRCIAKLNEYISSLLPRPTSHNGPDSSVIGTSHGLTTARPDSDAGRADHGRDHLRHGHGDLQRTA